MGEQSSLTEKLVASTLGGSFASLVLTPFDVVIRRVQAQADPLRMMSMSSQAQPEFRGSLDAALQIVRKEGVLSLWRGLTPALLMTAPATAFYYTLYDTLRGKIEPEIGQISPLVAGPIARSITVLATSPLELVPTLWRDVPFSALYWFLYEQTKKRIISYREKNVEKMNQNPLVPPKAHFQTNLLSGAFAGSWAALLTHPFDVAKTRRQMNLKIRTSILGSSSYPLKMGLILREIAREEGYRGLFRGLAPRIAKVTPACAIMISSYEWLSFYFFSHRKKQEKT